VADQANPAILQAVMLDGNAGEVKFSFDAVKAFTDHAARTFGVGESREGLFDGGKAKEAVKAAKKK
jgi:hypothetical protein